MNPTNEEFSSLEVSCTPDEFSSSKKSLSKTVTTHTFSSLKNDAEYTFTGTKAQWNAITKGSNWISSAKTSKVTCSDGEVDF